MVYWFIGQPCTGKTTLAKMFKKYLSENVCNAIYLDGDDLRKIFNDSYKPENFTREWREKNARVLHRMVTYLADQAFIVIIATVSPYRNVREEFKQSRKDIIEIYLHKSIIREREQYSVADYEPPLENFIDIDTTTDTIDESFVKVHKAINDVQMTRLTNAKKDGNIFK